MTEARTERLSKAVEHDTRGEKEFDSAQVALGDQRLTSDAKASLRQREIRRAGVTTFRLGRCPDP